MTERAETAGGSVIAGRYRLVQRIGHGGMGVVWRAWDEMLARHVAVKRLHPPAQLSEQDQVTLYERTRREARSAARISHPNVVVVHDVVDDEDGLPCIVMEYVPARTLADVLRHDGPVPPEEAARIGRGMVAALRAAHAAEVLHRDVKPGNVLLGEDGRVVLTDFGIAVSSGTSTLTKTGELVGSVDFLAPERLHGHAVGPASDLWALGATLYQAVEGRPPFRRDTAIETAYAIATQPLPEPRRAGPLAPLITEMLEKEAARRPSAEDVEWRLREAAAAASTATLSHATLQPTRSLEESALGVARGRRDEGADATGTLALRGSHDTTAPGRAVGAGAAATSGGGLAPWGQRPEDDRPAPPTDQDTTGGDVAVRSAPGAGGGRGTVTAVTVVAGAVVAVVALVVSGMVWLRTQDSSDGPDQVRASAPMRPPASASKVGPSPVPEGYRLVKVPELGIAFPVPRDWREKRRASTQVVYNDPSGRVGLRIDVLESASSDHVAHFEELERDFRARQDGYERLQLRSTSFRGYPAAVWECTFQGSASTFRAIDLGFGREGGTEYAIYLSAPSAEWQRYRTVFAHVRDGLRLPDE